MIRVFRRLAPEFDTLHPLSEEGPEEDLALIQRTFHSWAYLAGGDLVSYERWLWEQPAERIARSYGFYRTQLQLLQRQRSGDYWVLKSPAHLNTVEGLLRAFPDAAVVVCHRDMAEVIPSACSLFAVGVRFTSSLDADYLGRRFLDGTARTLDRLVEVRDRLPEDRVVDVRFDDLMADPAGSVHRIGEQLGYPPTDERSTAAHLEANPRHRHGVHRYSLEQYGLTLADVDAAAGRYHERFGIRLER
jgi:hypothetical protein